MDRVCPVRLCLGIDTGSVCAVVCNTLALDVNYDAVTAEPRRGRGSQVPELFTAVAP
jgi:hypothetical protein